ncbi:MAG: HEAT repeat domain-containing protein [Prochlorococcaceae cyanobacterium]|jgi:hypothetical protein
MNPSLFGGALALVLVLFWWRARPRTPLLRSLDATAVVDLNRQQIERLQRQASLLAPVPPELEPASEAASLASPPPQAPQRARWRRERLERLQAQLSGGGSRSRGALEEVLHWGDPAALPLLRRGLRHPDPAVVALAARGLERFRGPRRAPAQLLAASATAAVSRPRNVARTR